MFNLEQFVGTVIDSYHLTRYIGKGSYGWVFEANQQILGQYVARVAVKIIAPGSDQERKDIIREIQALAQLRHGHILAYLNSGQVEGGILARSVFLVTELAEISLERAIEPPSRLSEAELRGMAQEVASALAHIHDKGFVHRDVKPSNILRVEGRWKLADFGLVRAVQGSLISGSGRKGTLAYMAPEALDNQIGPATDIYALGVTLLQCLTGRLAHEGDTEAQFMANLLTKSPNIPTDLRDPWKTIITGCLERDPHPRWKAAQVCQQLTAPPQPPESKPEMRVMTSPEPQSRPPQPLAHEPKPGGRIFPIIRDRPKRAVDSIPPSIQNERDGTPLVLIPEGGVPGGGTRKQRRQGEVPGPPAGLLPGVASGDQRTVCPFPDRASPQRSGPGAVDLVGQRMHRAQSLPRT